MNMEKRIIEMPVILMKQANAKLREDSALAEKVLKENPSALMYFSDKIQTKFAKQISNTKHWHILQFCTNEECQSLYFEKYMDTVI